MKKKLIFIVLMACLLVGCGGNTEKTDALTDKEIDEVVERAEELSRELNMIDGFEKAEYERFNSYASENGLKGTPIYINGKIKSEQNSETDGMLAFVLEDEDENEWMVGIFDTESSRELVSSGIGKDIRIFGTYDGYSEKEKLPIVVTFSEDEEFLQKVKIEEKKPNNLHEIVWTFEDWAKGYSLKSGDNKNSQSEEKEEETPTMGESNALRSAKEYLSIMPFSHSGMVEQLEYDGYTNDEAIYAADNCGADWNEQAKKEAKSYLDIMAFSREELISQLEYDGYTHEQAVYGAEQNGY